MKSAKMDKPEWKQQMHKSCKKSLSKFKKQSAWAILLLVKAVIPCAGTHALQVLAESILKT